MPYKAFLSYSHKADQALAAELQHALQQFAKPYYALRAIQVFRDQTDLTANPALWSRIEGAINESEFFLLLASPAAAASYWVKRELDCWLSGHRGQPDRLFILWTNGVLTWDAKSGDFDWEKTTALPALLDWDPANRQPRSLHRLFREQPLWIDLGWTRG